MVSLTPAQQEVVAHDEGPALVFAVAGAGKTTAMVHRIERLVREDVFPASAILATSFGKRNQVDIREKLAAWPHCRPVTVRTLHALGRSAIIAAQELGHFQHLSLEKGAGEQSRADIVLNQAIAEARRLAVDYRLELDSLDRQDFLTYVASCKGSLLYADMDAAGPPPLGRSVAREAPRLSGPLSWYRDFYRLFEAVRLRLGMVTFADMLLGGWEALLLADVRDRFQRHFRCVLVDEYQDINRAQAEILDLITESHRNYMAIGDDDQTIYEWRGASPDFILDFHERYGGARYFIRENFRSPAAPLVLANRLIARNERRAAKRLRLTRGFFGETAVARDKDEAAMAAHIVRKIRALKKAGRSWNEIAVLVRLNAQTPYIEQGLISAGIPYRVSRPFYNRPEIRTLIHYVRLGWVERELRAGGALTGSLHQWFAEAWRDVYRRPKRYFSGAMRDRVQEMVNKGVAPTEAIRFVAPLGANERVVEMVEQLADDISWLADSLEGVAHTVLRELEVRLDYRQFLRDNSGFVQTGEGRAASVAAFVDYARGQGDLLAFMHHIRDLTEQKIGRKPAPGEGEVILSTIHGAKGLEWPVVFVAGCNQGLLPFQGERSENLEEERRLFYVALTRSSDCLYLHYAAGEPASPFLAEADANRLLPAVEKVGTLLRDDPDGWTAAEALLLARFVASQGLGGYFADWWQGPAGQRERIGRAMARFYAAVGAKDSWEPLRLAEKDGKLWRQIGAAKEEPAEFPGLDKLLAARETKAADNGGSREPDLISPGMWVLCDAGWGRVERIVDGAGRLASAMARGERAYSLEIVLRPGRDGTAAELDLAAGRIHFPGDGALYTCTKCLAITAQELGIIAGVHNDMAHNGVGARFRQERARERPLRTLVFRAEAPADLL